MLQIFDPSGFVGSFPGVKTVKLLPFPQFCTFVTTNFSQLAAVLNVTKQFGKAASAGSQMSEREPDAISAAPQLETRVFELVCN